MRVAFLADMLYYRIAGGTTRYAASLLRELGSLDSVETALFSVYGPETIARVAAERGYPEACSMPSRLPRPARYLLWHAFGLGSPVGGGSEEVDVVHTPSLLVPPSSRAPLVVTIHDISFRLFPRYHSRWPRAIAELGLRRAVSHADAIITDARSTADDLIRHTRAPASKLHVVPIAADPVFRPLDDPEILRKYGIDAPYLLFVGTFEPRKNILAIVEAFAELPDRSVKLVLTGAAGWLLEDMGARVAELKLQDRVIFTGYVPDESIAALMSSSLGFVYPSWYEGFGLPVLEAMQCGAPVITSCVSSLPEVVGDAALQVAPDDAAALRSAMARIVSEPGLREELRGRGLARAAQFSWKETARMTAEVYRSVVASR
jgi:glycosyltransferase involved in cell wall biosynthesis